MSTTWQFDCSRDIQGHMFPIKPGNKFTCIHKKCLLCKHVYSTVQTSNTFRFNESLAELACSVVALSGSVLAGCANSSPRVEKLAFFTSVVTAEEKAKEILVYGQIIFRVQEVSDCPERLARSTVVTSGVDDGSYEKARCHQQRTSSQSPNWQTSVHISD